MKIQEMGGKKKKKKKRTEKKPATPEAKRERIAFPFGCLLRGKGRRKERKRER